MNLIYLFPGFVDSFKRILSFIHSRELPTN